LTAMWSPNDFVTPAIAMASSWRVSVIDRL
jgi:hypothetical protein